MDQPRPAVTRVIEMDQHGKKREHIITMLDYIRLAESLPAPTADPYEIEARLQDLWDSLET